MSWENVKLGDIAEFSNGINFDKSAYSKGVKLIGVSNFGNRIFPDYDSLEEIKKEVVRSNDYLRDGDIVFVRSNGNKELVGRCMLIKNPKSPVTYSGFCIRVRLDDTKKHNPVFFTYLFKFFLPFSLYPSLN
jgi:type I restriction enzyme S subunit